MRGEIKVDLTKMTAIERAQYLLSLCLQLQAMPNGSGYIEAREGSGYPGATVFYNLAGHAGRLSIDIHADGWVAYSHATDVYEFTLTEPDVGDIYRREPEYEQAMFCECVARLRELIAAQGGDDNVQAR